MKTAVPLPEVRTSLSSPAHLFQAVARNARIGQPAHGARARSGGRASFLQLLLRSLSSWSA